MSHVDFGTFLDSWSVELSAQAQRVRQLIGNAHWLSDGNHKEAILRSFLRKYIPATYEVWTGFAVNPEHQHRLTKQQDILVCDLMSYSAFLVEESFSIVPSACVSGFIEVKSSLSAPVLKDAMEGVFFSSSVLSGQVSPPWRGIFFFSGELASAEHFKLWVEKVLKGIPSHQINPADGPLCIVVVGEFIAFLDIGLAGRGRLRILQAKEKSLAFGMIDLISTLRARLGGVSETQFESLALSAFSESPSIFEINY